jgi:hypothetical protein
MDRICLSKWITNEGNPIMRDVNPLILKASLNSFIGFYSDNEATHIRFMDYKRRNNLGDNANHTGWRIQLLRQFYVTKYIWEHPAMQSEKALLPQVQGPILSLAYMAYPCPELGAYAR